MEMMQFMKRTIYPHRNFKGYDIMYVDGMPQLHTMKQNNFGFIFQRRLHGPPCCQKCGRTASCLKANALIAVTFTQRISGTGARVVHKQKHSSLLGCITYVYHAAKKHGYEAMLLEDEQPHDVLGTFHQNMVTLFFKVTCHSQANDEVPEIERVARRQAAHTTRLQVETILRDKAAQDRAEMIRQYEVNAKVEAARKSTTKEATHQATGSDTAGVHVSGKRKRIRVEEDSPRKKRCFVPTFESTKRGYYQSITAMPEYTEKSFEELRWESYTSSAACEATDSL